MKLYNRIDKCYMIQFNSNEMIYWIGLAKRSYEEFRTINEAWPNPFDRPLKCNTQEGIEFKIKNN